MAKECVARGVTIRTACAVRSIDVVNGRASGVTLDSGESIVATRVVANVNPKLLFERLVAPEHVDADFRARIDGYRCGSGTFRMNVALSELPDFTCAPGRSAAPHHGSGIIIAPSLAYMKTPNAEPAFLKGATPLLTIDVWEHAYYLDYQNRRPDHVNAVIDKLLNWNFAAENLARA